MSRFFAFVFFLVLFVTAGCATSADSGSGKESFRNLLVIGVAGNWNSRAQFERVVVSGLRAEGVDAQSYNLVAGGDKLPTRDDVLAAIDERGFDAIVVTRVLGTESDVDTPGAVAGAKVTRKDSGFMKLFRYDYEELDEPLQLTVNTRVDFVTELYSAASRELVWSSETKAPQSDNVAALIDESAKLVVRQLRRSGRLASR
jgi:hypothetical protein